MTDKERAEKAERQLFEVGIQLAAAQERLRLLEEVAYRARKTVAANWRVIDAAPLTIALLALDTVPGDAPVKP
jgi:hypothetical protein